MGKRRSAPTNEEIIQFEVLRSMGMNYKKISEKLNRSAHTVKRYLTLPQKAIKDPELKEIIRLIREREIEDLTLLGAKARKRLHDLLDEGKTKAVETTVIMDKSFQQRRLLEGSSTANIRVESFEEYLFRLRREQGLDPPGLYPLPAVDTTACIEQKDEDEDKKDVITRIKG